jgi:3-hydroxyacyl-[acyl-carrier-protein] dehydratase
MTGLLGRPISGTVETGPPDGGPQTIHLTVSPDEPVFQGHYPGLPVFPGVCLVDFVHQGALALIPQPERRWRLAAVDRVRFLSPVLPGDRLTGRLGWRRHHDLWRCSAEVSTARGAVARMRIDFREGTAAR